ncbi:hypothetical protein [Nitrospira sp. BLG_1]|uniref:hypothetical protein n=1 Tax=Nitrospira sp. BLG_1 TaxID=3395883 RepID=UPI0039BC4794
MENEQQADAVVDATSLVPKTRKYGSNRTTQPRIERLRNLPEGQALIIYCSKEVSGKAQRSLGGTLAILRAAGYVLKTMQVEGGLAVIKIRDPKLAGDFA